MKYLFTSLVVLLSHALLAQAFDQDKLDKFLNVIEENQKGMGSLSILKDGKEVYQKSIGYMDFNKDMTPTAGTKYRIGSISKTFTATIIMQLIEEGKLTLDTKLSDYYPKVKNADNITIEHLLRHRSGIFNFTNMPDYIDWMEQPTTDKDLLEKIISLESNFKPGSMAEYSNSGYILLSLIIQEIDGKKFSASLEKRIVKKLNLKNTYFGGKINTDENEAKSYMKLEDWEEATETDMSVPLGAGSIVSTPTDLNMFLYSLYNGKLVSDESLKSMMELKDNFGLGMFRVPFYDRYAYGHNGGIDGFQSNAYHFTKDNVTVAFLSNGAAMPLNDILIGILSIYFGRDFEIPDFKILYEPTSEELESYLGVYSSSTFPLKITISRKGSTLMAQATGQPSFVLEPTEKAKFKFDAAMLKMEFFPEEKSLVFQQGGASYKLEKE